MAQLDDRREAFEAKYKHDQDIQFKVQVRTSRLLGLWAAEKLGLTGADAEAYAAGIVDADFEEPGFEDVIRVLKKDFAEKNIDISDHHIRVELDRKLEEAKKQIMSE